MALTIDLKPELEAQLREEAAKIGVDAGVFVARALEERLRGNKRRSVSAHLSAEEASLLLKINQGLPESVWQEYRDLIARRRAEVLTPEEHTRLIALSDTIEQANTARMINAAELAQLQQIPLRTLLKQLGIKPRKA